MCFWTNYNYLELIFYSSNNQIYVYFWRYYGLKPKLDDAYGRIKELERENDFLKWSKVVKDSNSEQATIDHIKKTFCDVLTQTQSIPKVDKVCFSEDKNIFIRILHEYT